MDSWIFVVLIGAIFAALVIGIMIGRWVAKLSFRRLVPLIRKDAVERSRAVLSGQFSEQLAPYLPDFNYLPTEVRFIGKPVDFIVFRGMDHQEIEEVVFVEVKSGKSKMNRSERGLKEAIQSGRVRWEEYRVPEELTTPIRRNGRPGK